MPTGLPSTIYTGGAVTFSNQPSVNLYAQLAARRQARQEALDQYYQNLHKNINPAGMRTQDISGGFNQKVSEWEKHFLENKQRITNPRNADDRQVAIENQQRYQDLLMDVQKSKDAAQQELELAKNKIAGKWNPTDEDLNIAHSISNSIYSPEYYKDQAKTQPYTLNDLSLNVPQFDPEQQQQFYKAATQGLTGGKVYDDKNVRRKDGQMFIPYEQSYTQDQLKTISDRAANLFEGSRSAKVHYEHLMHDPNFLIPANQAYQSVYGTKEIVDTPKKAAQAAQIMAAKQERTTGEEIRKDDERDFQQQLYLKKYEHSLKQGDQDNANLWIDRYVKGISDDAVKTGKEQVYMFADGTKVDGYKIQADPTLNKAVGFDAKNPGTIIVTKDGNYIIAPYKQVWDDKAKEMVTSKVNGTYAVDTERAAKISPEQLKLALGKQSGVKQMNKEMIAGETPPPKKKEIKNSAIKAAAEAGGYTEKEYKALLKQKGIKIVD